eukprot:309239-Pleurochrysis_carterae.AAC.3
MAGEKDLAEVKKQQQALRAERQAAKQEAEVTADAAGDGGDVRNALEKARTPFGAGERERPFRRGNVT